MFAQINGTKIFFDIDGAGYIPKNGRLTQKPVCFVLHGGPGEAHGYFKPFLNELTEDMQLVYIDQRGSGYSAKGQQESYSLENNVEDIEELRKYLGLEKVWLLGHSYGGMVALKYALKYDVHLAGLILTTTAASYRFLEKAQKYVAEHGTEEQKRFGDILFNGKFTSNEEVDQYYVVMESLYVNTAAPTNHKGKELDVLMELDRSYEALNEGFGNFLREFDVTDRLPEIKVPTLVIAGRHDWITPVEESELIADRIPNSLFIVLEKSSHSVMEEETAAYNRTVKAFVREHHTK